MAAKQAEVVAFYPHRSETPKSLWMDLLKSAQKELWLLAYASLFLPEQNPEVIALIKHKAANGVDVRIVLGDPDSAEAELRGREEQLYDAIPARIKMALAYYRPLTEVAGVHFHLHRTTLYNSIFRFDDQLLVNQHIYGAYGYIAPILHLRRVDGADLRDLHDEFRARLGGVVSLEGSRLAGHARPASVLTAKTTASVSRRSSKTASAPSACSASGESMPVATPMTRAPPVSLRERLASCLRSEQSNSRRRRRRTSPEPGAARDRPTGAGRCRLIRIHRSRNR